MGRDKEEEKGRGNGEISPGKVYRQDPSFLEWCTEIARYLCQKWRRGDIQLQEEIQLQEPTEAAKCADVQEPILKREPHRSVKQPLETARKKVTTSIIAD